MKVLLIDDHPLFAFGFAQALTQADADIEVTTVATIQAGLAQAASAGDIDIALIDYRLSEGDGIEGLKRFGDHFPLVARVLISGIEDEVLVARAKNAGASGFIGKSLTLDAVRDALQNIASGAAAFPKAPRLQSGLGAPQPTARQLEVLTLIAQGHPNKRIANDLGISDRTVKLHVTALLTALAAKNRTHLLIVARERGLV